MGDWRLGLDLGTNSIGWCVLKTENGKPKELLDIGVRIFPDGREPAAEGRVGDSLAVQRRIARGMRRRRDRKIRQKRKVFHFLVEAGLMPDDADQQEKLKQLDPYELRVKALDKKLKPQELGRVLFHLCVRRGFKSNRKEALTADKELSTNLQKIQNFKHELKKNNSRTLGEYLYRKKSKGQTIRFRPAESSFYAERSMYEEEFKAIKEIQKSQYPALDWDTIEDLIFFQRPLRKQERGRCQFYTEKYRAHKALPISHRFRILQDINNLMMIDDKGSKINLNDEEKELLFDKMENRKTISFNSIRKLLNTDFTFNLENRSDDKLKGNETCCDLRKDEYFGDIWDSLPFDRQDDIVELLIDAENNETIVNYLSDLHLTDKQLNSILNKTFSATTTNLSKEFMRDCAKIIRERHLPYHLAVQEIGLHHSDRLSKKTFQKLPYYGEVLQGSTIGAHPNLTGVEAGPEVRFGRIGNPTVHIALNQLRKVVNVLIDRFGRPSEISIELSRELRQSRSSRLERFNVNKQNKKTNDRIITEIQSLGISRPSGWDIKKYKLWEELGNSGVARRCVYCGKTISASQLFSPQIEIEHILPYSRTLMNSLGNLTVAHKECNAAKGGKSPCEAFSHNPKDFDYQEILERVKVLPRTKRQKFYDGAVEDYNKDVNFVDRQLTDNAYLSRKAREYLSCIFHSNTGNPVWVVTGRLTGLMRSAWGLNTILNANGNRHFKNREDHRHHAIDALVIGLTDRSTVQQISTLNAFESPLSFKAPQFPFHHREIENKVSNIIVSFKPDHGKQGRLFKETALGRHTRIEQRPFARIKSPEQVESICSSVWKRKFNEIMHELGFKKARKVIQAEWTQDHDTEIGPASFVAHWVSRKPLTEIKKTEIPRIWDDGLREKILHDIPVDEMNEKELAEALSRFGAHNNIRSVRYIPDNTINTIKITSAPNKGYVPDDYLYVEIWAIPGKKMGKWEYHGQFRTRFEAVQENRDFEKPHPAAKKLMELYKNDLISLTSDDGNIVFARVAGFSATNNKLDLRPMYAARDCKKWLKETNKKLTNGFWKPNPGHYFLSINALWSNNVIKKKRVSVDGHFSR